MHHGEEEEEVVNLFDEKVLIDLDDEEEVVNLFAHNERIGHIYIAPIKNDSTSPIMNVDM